MLNPYNKNLSTAYKTLSKVVKISGNPNAEEALSILKQHISRKSPRTKPKTAKTYGIGLTDVVRQSDLYLSGEKTPRSFNIQQLVEGIGDSGRSVSILKKELGVCERDIDYLKKFGYIEISKSA